MTGHSFPPRLIWICVVGLTVLVAWHLSARALPFPFTPDSAVYIDEAERLLVDLGIRPPPPSGVPPPSPLFPPGFGMSVAMLGALGLDLPVAVLLIASACALVLPVLLVLVFRRLLDPVALLVLVAAVVTTPGFLAQALLGLSDLLALVLGLGAVGLVLQAYRTSTFVAAGVLAGCAYAVRNAHAALLIAFTCYFAFALYRNSLPRRIEAARAIAFSGGVAMIVLPLFAANLTTFGVINPYSMGPSTIDVVTNVRTFIQESVFDLSGSRVLAVYAAWSAPGLAVLALLAGLILWLTRNLPAALTPEALRAFILCVVYALTGSVMVIAARSTFEWGEPINVRHTLQYSPFWFAAGLLLLRAYAPASSGGWSFARAAGAGLLVVTLGLHLVYLVTLDGPARFNVERAAAAQSALEAGRSSVCPSGRIVLSNWPHVFRIGCGFPVWSFGEGPKIDTQIPAVRDAHPGRELLIALFPGRGGFTAAHFPIPESEKKRLENEGFALELNSSNGLVMIFHAGQSPGSDIAAY